MLKEPESNDLVDLCAGWYYSTIEAREVDHMSGLIKKLTWRDVKELLEYRPSPVPVRDLAAIAFVIDDTYITHCAKQREKNRSAQK